MTGRLKELLAKDESAKFDVEIDDKANEDWKVIYRVMPTINKAVMNHLQEVALKKMEENPKFYDYLDTLNQNIGLDPSMQLKKH